MSRFIGSLLILLTLAAGIYGAHAFGLGEGNRFGRLGSMRKNGTGGGGGTTGKILLVDGTSFILQTDGASKICRAGGC